jgi:hypothetical protein
MPTRDRRSDAWMRQYGARRKSKDPSHRYCDRSKVSHRLGVASRSERAAFTDERSSDAVVLSDAYALDRETLNLMQRRMHDRAGVINTNSFFRHSISRRRSQNTRDVFGARWRNSGPSKVKRSPARRSVRVSTRGTHTRILCLAGIYGSKAAARGRCGSHDISLCKA